MLRQHNDNLRALLLFVDIGLCVAVFGLCLASAERAAGSGIVAQIGIGPLLLLLTTSALGMPISVRLLSGRGSLRRKSPVSILGEIVGAGLVAFLVSATTAFALSIPMTPELLATCVTGQVFSLAVARLTIVFGLRLLRRRGRNFRNVLVIGTGPRARSVCESIEAHPEWGLRIVGFVDESDEPLDPMIPRDLAHKLSDMPMLIRDHVIDEVIAACPRSMLASIGPVVAACSATGVPLTVLTDLFGDYLPPPRVDRFDSHAALSFAPVHHNVFELGIKRAIDIAGSAFLLLLSAPILAISALGIALTSRGPIFFMQMRCGLNGRPFRMIKLRTMVPDAEDRRAELESHNEMSGPVFKMRRDPRVTPVGRVLRRFSIDELPQLWNVLVGDMSLIGPRPAIPSEVVQYEVSERRRLSMRPGLSCLWQVRGRNRLGFEEWVKLDLEYIDSWSLLLDLRILLLTIPAVLQGSGE